MAGAADFLVEIGTEELPPKALRRLELAFAAGIADGLEKAGLERAPLQSFATPRRLAVLVPELQLEQPERRLEKRGPPVRVAFDAGGKPTRAAEAFAQGCKVPVGELGRLTTNKGEWLVFRGTEPGRKAGELLPGIVRNTLAALPIPRRMRWGDNESEFVRPVHWVVMLLGKSVIDCRILGLAAGNQTRGHRFHAPDPIAIRKPADYAKLLENKGQVIADFSERRERIESMASRAATHSGGVAVLNEDVLDEVTALVEWPVALEGAFDEEFLTLPEEVLVSSLQEHQRYFPVRAQDGKLMPKFITISNLASTDPEQVRAGNERVVHPRLSDAAFFWMQDCRTSLASRLGRLDDVVYQRGLGSLRDKSRRVEALARTIGVVVGADETITARAAELAKTDLLTEMVGEFPELQGRMGYHYALNDGEKPEVAAAIEEQYLPRHAGDRLPPSAAGQAIALADRLDTVAGIFGIGKRPTGNKDPFGLRRAALGVLRILIEAGIDIDLRAVLRQALALQGLGTADQDQLIEALYAFFTDRLRTWYLEGQAPGLKRGAVSAELFEAVRARAPASPADFHARLLAVEHFMQLDAAASLAAANKRIANILRTATDEEEADVDPSLFEADEERELHEAVRGILTAHGHAVAERQYGLVLKSLAGLRGPVDAFFDGVMVMTDDQAQRLNRIAQLRLLRRLFLDVADLSCIPTA